MATVTHDIDLIQLIDDLGDASDRCEALSLMAQALGDDNRSSAFERVIGDVQRQVEKSLRALNQVHEQRGTA